MRPQASQATRDQHACLDPWEVQLPPARALSTGLAFSPPSPQRSLPPRFCSKQDCALFAGAGLSGQETLRPAPMDFLSRCCGRPALCILEEMTATCITCKHQRKLWVLIFRWHGKHEQKPNKTNLIIRDLSLLPNIFWVWTVRDDRASKHLLFSVCFLNNCFIFTSPNIPLLYFE